MKKNVTLGLVLSFAAGAATAIASTVAIHKAIKEIKNDTKEQDFPSPDGNNLVTLAYGSSKTAMGLGCIQVKVTADADTCRLILLTKRIPETFDAQWSDNEHFQLLVGKGKRKQCCDVSFEEGHIRANYYLNKKC